MKMSACIGTYQDKTLGEALDILKSMGLDAVEIGAGGYSDKGHCNPEKLLKDEDLFKAFKEELDKRDMTVSAFSAHGNPVHPQPEIAKQHDADIKACIDLASKMGVKNVITFSGSPGDHDGALYPNWIIYPFPAENQEIMRYQWEEKLIPYWKETGDYAADRGVVVGLEMHGGFTVHSPATMIRLREETGKKSVSCNVDPSHLWWQGIDPVMAIRYLANAGCISYFHAKDTAAEKSNADYYSLLDEQSFMNTRDRAWQFRSIGYGHSTKEWADIISTLRAVGYDDYVSIEHEDGLMSENEGFRRAIDNLRSVMITEEAYVPPIFKK